MIAESFRSNAYDLKDRLKRAGFPSKVVAVEPSKLRIPSPIGFAAGFCRMTGSIPLTEYFFEQNEEH